MSLIFFNEKKLRNIGISFDIENWLWKSEIGIFRSLDLEQMLIWQKFFYEKVLFIPFDAEIAEKILNGIYCIGVNFKRTDMIFFSCKTISLMAFFPKYASNNLLVTDSFLKHFVSTKNRIIFSRSFFITTLPKNICFKSGVS